MAIWEVLIGSEAFALSDRRPFDVVSVTGVGISPVRRITQSGPQQHGETDLGFRLEARHLNLVLLAQAGSPAEVDAARDALAYLFGPRERAPLVLRCTRDDGAVRQIDCRPSGFLDFPVTPDDRYGPRQKVGVQLAASEPNWYDPEARQSSFGLAGFSAGMQIPWMEPLLFASGSGGDGTVQINYGGSFDEYPLITIDGPVQDAYIENVTTGDLLSFSGYTIPNGESVFVDLRYGFKSVKSSTGANRIDALSDDSDLATFRLLSTLESEGGRNQFRLSGLSLGASSRVSFTYHHRFLSL